MNLRFWRTKTLNLTLSREVASKSRSQRLCPSFSLYPDLGVLPTITFWGAYEVLDFLVGNRHAAPRGALVVRLYGTV